MSYARYSLSSNIVFIYCFVSGAGSVLQHIVAHGGNTQPPLFRIAMTSSTFLPSQYNYNDRIPEVSFVHEDDVRSPEYNY